MNYEVLKDEISVDPLVRGYSGMTQQQVADDMNTVYRTRNRDIVSGKAVKDAFAGESAEWAAITAEGRSEVLSLIARDDLDPFGVDAMIFQQAIGANAPNTLAALVAYRVESVSRADELGLGVVTVTAIESSEIWV